MYVVLVRFTVKPESVEAFRPLVLQQAKNSLTNEEACRQFDVSTDPENPAEFLLYEIYDNRAAFDAHTQTEYFAQFGGAIEDLIMGKEISCWERIEA